jgi:hypothetical protein
MHIRGTTVIIILDCRVVDFLFSESLGTNKRIVTRRCFYRPFCTKMADECQGYNRGGCIEVVSKRVIINVTPEEHKKLKEKLDREEKNKKVAETRSEKKRARHS